MKTKLIRDDGVIFVSFGFPGDDRPSEADIEDLVEPAVIVKRYEAAFAAAGLEFHKTHPARLFLTSSGEISSDQRSFGSTGR